MYKCTSALVMLKFKKIKQSRTNMSNTVPLDNTPKNTFPNDCHDKYILMIEININLQYLIYVIPQMYEKPEIWTKTQNKQKSFFRTT